MAKALALAFAAMIATVLNRLSGDKFKAWMPWFTDELLRIAIRRLPEAGRERFSEEWASHLDEVSGEMSKVLVALGCVSAGRQMALSLKSAEPVRKRSLSTWRLLIRVRTAGSQSRALMDSAMTLFLNMVGVGSDESSERSWTTIVLIPTLVAAVVGALVSYAFTPKWTSQSTILVEGQIVPENIVQPVVSEDLGARMATLQQRVLSQADLQPVVERVFAGKNSQQVGEIIDNIRLNMTVQQVPTDLLQLGVKKEPGAGGNSGGFYVSYTAPNPSEAQQICAELTSLLMNENLKSVQAAAKGTSDLLDRGIEDAKHNLDDLDARMADFKRRYVGQLPGDEENNLKVLMDLNSQLEANTQTLNRAQQDKAYDESTLAQQLEAWQSTHSTNNRLTLQQQLIDLQAQLIDLQARDASEHADVGKIKADIAQVRKKLTEINDASPDATDKASAMEPPEIRQLRLQIHQYGDLIAAATRDQKRLQQEIAAYQGRVTLSPTVEQQYSELTRDYGNALKNYQDLQAKKSSADLTVNMYTTTSRFLSMAS